MAVNATETVSIPQNDSKTPNLPMETARRRPDEPNSCRSRADGLSVRTNAHSVETDTEMAENSSRSVRKRQTEVQTRNSPSTIEITMAKLPSQWRRVSAGDGDVYIPCNAPIEVLGTANQQIIFG